MEQLARFFLHQWQRKLLALITATTIWIFVNHSIIDIKTIPSVPVRIVNLPVDRTIQGLLPNGFLSKRMTLTLNGTKDVIEQLEPGDLEILIDVSNQPSEGAVQVAKKNLVSLNPNINLTNHVTSLSHSELMIKMSPMLTDKIPVIIHRPSGHPPEGYDFLDIWPVRLTQTISGPQEQVLNLKEHGLELTFNLSDITKEQLDTLQTEQYHQYDDELIFYIPEQWKKIIIPSLTNIPETLNDPQAKNLQIAFLKKDYLPIKGDIPAAVFYPLKHSSTINPLTYPLAQNLFIQFENSIPILKASLFAYHVSKLFLDIVKDNLQINIVAAPKSEQERLEWDVGFIDSPRLEDAYVTASLSKLKKIPESESYLRRRFQSYMVKFALYLPTKQPLTLESSLEEGQVVVHVPNLQPLPSKFKTHNAR